MLGDVVHGVKYSCRPPTTERLDLCPEPPTTSVTRAVILIRAPALGKREIKTETSRGMSHKVSPWRALCSMNSFVVDEDGMALVIAMCPCTGTGALSPCLTLRV